MVMGCILSFGLYARMWLPFRYAYRCEALAYDMP